MAESDRKVPKKVLIPLPGTRDGHQKVQRLEPLAPHPAPKPKPKKKLAKAVKKKESEYAELKQVHRVNPDYEPLSTATRERATKLVPDTKKGEQTQEARGAHASPADPELHYDDVKISSHQDHKLLQAKLSGKLSNELGAAVEVAGSTAENRVRYENAYIQSRQDHGKQTAKAKKIGEEKHIASEEAPPGLTTDIEIHYDDIGLKSRRAHNIKNYVNYDIKDFDDPESKLSENDFHTNCCYAYRKGILTIGITATAVVILVVVFMALVIAGLSQSRENSQEYQELHHMVQSMAEQIVSLEQQLNQSVTSSESALRQQIMILTEQFAANLETAVEQQAEDLQRHITDSENMLLLIVVDNEEKIDGVERVLSDQISNLDQTKATASDLGEVHNELDSHIQEFQQATDSLTLRDDTLEDRVDTEITNLHSLDTDHTSRLDELRDDVNGLVTDVNGLLINVTLLQKNVALNCSYCF